MSIDVFHLLLLILASFRLTRLILFDRITHWIRNPFLEEKEEQLQDGTYEIYLNIKGSGFRRWVGELLSCYWCTGMWSTILLLGGYWVLPSYFIPIIIVFAVAAAASIIETIVQRLS
ncbi:DUF1360 domain-containing protein [Alkalihalobacillus deserti]|uniref:DUF1360 domain-containing protein n=1 Tax=Alkalihalobacillus deserti TaxID=2879466 RepID=UPI001D14C1F5|nr:DUF1360 domain-containing protein [Alkalihalobacillus deserti]